MSKSKFYPVDNEEAIDTRKEYTKKERTERIVKSLSSHFVKIIGDLEDEENEHDTTIQIITSDGLFENQLFEIRNAGFNLKRVVPIAFLLDGRPAILLEFKD